MFISAAPRSSRAQSTPSQRTGSAQQSAPPVPTYELARLPIGVSRDAWKQVSDDWSGTGQKFDVEYTSLSPAYQSQLKKQAVLGRGGYGQVYKINYRQVDMARKSVKIDHTISQARHDLMKAESAIGQKLDSHRHIIKLVGTYWKGPYHLNILTFPVATCDLGHFLDVWQSRWVDRSGTTRRLSEVARTLFDALELGLAHLDYDDRKRSRVADKRLWQIMGCTTQALLWMHSQRIQHRDLKPPNILLGPGQLYLTDFGISRDRSKEERSTTEYHVGHSYGYAAPEVLAGDRYNASEADIYSLGCVFLHILTAYHQADESRWQTERPRDPNENVHLYRERQFTWFLRNRNWTQHPFIPLSFVKFIAPLLNVDRKQRPNTYKVDESLKMAEEQGDSVYYGPCCRPPGAVPNSRPPIRSSQVRRGAATGATSSGNGIASQPRSTSNQIDLDAPRLPRTEQQQT